MLSLFLCDMASMRSQKEVSFVSSHPDSGPTAEKPIVSSPRQEKDSFGKDRSAICVQMFNAQGFTRL